MIEIILTLRFVVAMLCQCYSPEPSLLIRSLDLVQSLGHECRCSPTTDAVQRWDRRFRAD